MEASREPNSDGPDHDLYTIPSFTSWFSWNNIHEVERLSLGEFFDGSSITRTPRIYKEYRDFIISRYREDPTRNLTFAEVRKSLVGDVCVLQKVFTFLEKWGLINFDPSKPEPVLFGADEKEEEEDENWRIRVEEGAPHGVRVIAAPNSLKPLAPLPPPPPAAVGGAAENGLKRPPLASYSDVYAQLLEQQRKEILVCGNCKEPCASEHYEYSKHQEGSLILCEKCFKDGNFDKDKSADDFKFIESGSHQVVWTEGETLLLFESVLKHGDDWDLVTQNVKTKNKLECISKLIQLPFGDLMLGSAHRKNRFCDTNGDVNGLKQAQPAASSEPQVAMKTEHQPDDSNNVQQNGDNENQELPMKRRCSVPISAPSSSLMKQVAHISTVVGPWVTSSATEAAVTALCYENQCSREIFDDGDSFDDELESSLEINEQERDPQAEGAEIDKPSSDTRDKSSPKSFIPLTLQMRAATAAALGGAAAHANLLADQEHREMENLVSTLIDAQLKKLQRKVKHMKELELIMENQQTQMKELEATILDERLDVLHRIFSIGTAKSKGDASMVSKPQNIDAV